MQKILRFTVMVNATSNVQLEKMCIRDRYGNVYLIFPIEELSVQIGKCKSSVKTALKELDDVGLLVRRSGGFSKPNHLYVRIPSDEVVLQPVDDKADEKMAAIESEKQPSSGRKNGCTGVGNVAPSKVTEKYKSKDVYKRQVLNIEKYHGKKFSEKRV